MILCYVHICMIERTYLVEGTTVIDTESSPRHGAGAGRVVDRVSCHGSYSVRCRINPATSSRILRRHHNIAVSSVRRRARLANGSYSGWCQRVIGSRRCRLQWHVASWNPTREVPCIDRKYLTMVQGSHRHRFYFHISWIGFVRRRGSGILFFRTGKWIRHRKSSLVARTRTFEK